MKHFGKLICEACNLNFVDKYGSRGEDFIECHHKIPLSQLEEGYKTTVDDLALLCSNCHRMIHREPYLTVDELAEIVNDHGILE